MKINKLLKLIAIIAATAPLSLSFAVLSPRPLLSVIVSIVLPIIYTGTVLLSLLAGKKSLNIIALNLVAILMNSITLLPIFFMLLIDAYIVIPIIYTALSIIYLLFVNTIVFTLFIFIDSFDAKIIDYFTSVNSIYIGAVKGFRGSYKQISPNFLGKK